MDSNEKNFQEIEFDSLNTNSKERDLNMAIGSVRSC